MDTRINQLMSKAQESGLSENERQLLTQTIAKRKALPV
jgi:hypothetical protein